MPEKLSRDLDSLTGHSYGSLGGKNVRKNIASGSVCGFNEKRILWGG